MLKTSPLYSEHLELGAKIGSFAGWRVPLFYSSIFAECKHCRKKAALFDISHMGEFVFKGDIKTSGIEKAVTPCLEEIPPGRSRYGFILNQAGGVVDDLLVFKIKPDQLLFVVNASSEAIDYKILKEIISQGELKNISAQTAKIDLQGPLSREVLKQALDFNRDISYFSFIEFSFKGEKILISRTGYTGELGYEIFLPNRLAPFLWRQLIANEQVKPVGFGARDILRLEMGYNLAGNDLTGAITPLQAGLGKFINFKKDFIGKSALLEQKNKGVKKTQVAFVAESRKIPRPGYKIYSAGKRIGEVTSGTYSPLLSAGIGIGYIGAKYKKSNHPIYLEDNKQNKFKAQIVDLPFYKRKGVRS
jgi:aminomethyltransferase